MRAILRSLTPSLALASFAVGLCAAPSEPQLVVQRAGDDGIPVSVGHARPLDMLVLESGGTGSIEVRDGADRVYFKAPLGGRVSFRAGGALGTQRVITRDASGG